MKKVFIVLLFALCTMAVQAQWKLGAHVGVPSGDFEKLYTTDVGFEAYKMFGTDRNGLLKLGVGSGYVSYFGDGDIENAQFIPLAGAARLNFLLFTIGPDIGYAFGISDGLDNGFYWKAVAGVKVLKILEIDLFYQSTSLIGESSLGSAGIAALLRF